MEIFTDVMNVFSGLSMEHMNALIAMGALGVAGFAIYLALVTVKGRKR